MAGRAVVTAKPVRAVSRVKTFMVLLLFFRCVLARIGGICEDDVRMVLKVVSCVKTGLSCVFNRTECLVAKVLLTSTVIESLKAAL